jgi:hypothetical protein
MGGLEVVLVAAAICAVLARQFNRPVREKRRAEHVRAGLEEEPPVDYADERT